LSNFGGERIYSTRMEEFERMLRETFRKRKDLFTPSRAHKATRRHPYQIKKWLPKLVQRGKLRKVTAYFFGCPPDELIVQDFGFGEVAICPVCNFEVPWPPDNPRRIICANCGTEYVKCVCYDPNSCPLLYPEEPVSNSEKKVNVPDCTGDFLF